MDENANKNRVDPMNSDFANLRAIQESLMVNNLNIQRLLLDDSSNSTLPNSGKGTKAQVNKPEIQVKYERLEKLSNQAEKQGLSFALDRDTIYDGVSKSGVKEGTKDGLLKEAGFTNSEREAIKKQEIKEGSKKLEDRAVERMNSAVEKVSKEYKDGILKLAQGKAISEAFPNISKDLLPKLTNIILKEQTIKKERL